MSETRFISENYDRYDGLSIEGYQKLGGFKALEKVQAMTKEQVCADLVSSGLQGRGGAAYGTGIKWQQALSVIGPEKVVICNADEGEPCTFKDRVMLEKDAYRVVEGMLIAGYAVGATKGYIYLREEYRHLRRRLQDVLASCEASGFLGEDKGFTIDLYSGAGAYVCGEGSSLIESMEGKSGRPRIKPPFIKEAGLFLKPTLVNNVETLACVTAIFQHGVSAFTAYGVGKSTGTKLISLAGNVNHPGAYEIAFGTTIREVIDNLGGGVEEGGQVQFFQLGGASGRLGTKEHLDVPYTYEALSKAGLDVGSGGFLVVDENTSIIDFIKAIQDFFVHESCGKCTPCREGNRQIGHIVDRWQKGEGRALDLQTAKRFANIMKSCSFCGLGETSQSALLSAIKYFPEDFKTQEDNL